MEECKYCHDDQVVPVLDKEMEQQPRAGNKYRRHCLSCERWLPMCSEEYFRTHSDPHCLPIGEHEIVRLSEVGVNEGYSMSDLVDQGTEGSVVSRQSSDVYEVGQNRAMRKEIVIECVLDMTVEGFIDKETATQYLSHRFGESNS
mgnify:FL=1